MLTLHYRLCERMSLDNSHNEGKQDHLPLTNRGIEGKPGVSIRVLK